jgi:hypothetical protein
MVNPLRVKKSPANEVGLAAKFVIRIEPGMTTLFVRKGSPQRTYLNQKPARRLAGFTTGSLGKFSDHSLTPDRRL